jgi:hypothetical protein
MVHVPNVCCRNISVDFSSHEAYKALSISVFHADDPLAKWLDVTGGDWQQIQQAYMVLNMTLIIMRRTVIHYLKGICVLASLFLSKKTSPSPNSLPLTYVFLDDL